MQIGPAISIAASHRPLTPALWTPAELTTALWLDAADTTTITASSGAVSQWGDKSGNGNHATQATAALRPMTGSATLNGRNVLQFSDKWLALPGDVGMKAAVFVFDQANGSNVNDIDTPLASDYGTSGPRDYIFARTNSIDESYDISIDGQNARSGSGTFNGGSLVAGTNIDFGATNAEVEGRVVFYVEYVDSDIVVNHIARMYVDANDFAARVNFAEVIILPAALSAADRRRMEGYLAHKWGVTLSSGHPFETMAPTL